LETSFCTELATVCIVRNDFNKARYYVQRSWEMFINTWSNLHPLVDTVRRSMLKNLQRLVEMDEFLQVLRQIQPTNQIQVVERLRGAWKARYPSRSSDSSNVWDDVVFGRAVMLKKLLGIVERDQKLIEAAGVRANDLQADIEMGVDDLKRNLQQVEG